MLLTFCLQGIELSDEVILKRNWQNYSKELLINNLKDMYFSNQISSVQSMWNTFENELIPMIDKIVPVVPFKQNVTLSSQKVSPIIKNKINQRNRLLKRFKINHNQEIKQRISNLNCEIRQHFTQIKKRKVRLGIIPGNSKTLWDSVKIAKDLNIQTIPPK